MSAWLKCLNVDIGRNMALVKSNRTGKSFAVTIHRAREQRAANMKIVSLAPEVL